MSETGARPTESAVSRAPASRPLSLSDTARSAAGQGFFETHERELSERAKWLLFWRMLVAVACLAILLVREGGQVREYATAYALILLLFPLTLVYIAVFRRIRDVERFILFQIAVDVVFETTLVYLTGGLFNVGFGFLYFLTVLSASFLVSDKAGLIVASVVTVLQAGVAVVYRVASEYDWNPPLLSRHLLETLDLAWNWIVANLIGTAVGYHLVAALAGLLPYRVSRVRLLYDEILDSMREGLVAIDNSGRIAFVNREARRLLNWEGLSRIDGRRYHEVLRRKEDRRILEILTGDKDVHEEIELELRNRGRVVVEVKTAVLRDQHGRLRGVIGIFADATLRRTLGDMETRLARLESTHEMALGIAHEIRNPLASIRGAVQELVKEGDARFADDDHRLAAVVRGESDRLDRLIEEFLAFARVRPPERRLTDLGRVVEDAVLLLRTREDARAIDVRLDLPPRAGDGRTFLVDGDAEQLRQAFLNIGINAVQALGGTGSLVVALRHATLPARAEVPGGGRLVEERAGADVTFDDDGPGVPADLRVKIFTPFFSTKKGGLGLGLAIVQKILRDHQGDVACEPNPMGRGTRFRLTLPLASAPTPAAGTPLAPRTSAGGTP